MKGQGRTLALYLSASDSFSRSFCQMKIVFGYRFFFSGDIERIINPDLNQISE